MPFAHEFDAVHKCIRRACTDAAVEPVRADDVFQGRPVLEKILTGIEQCRVVVADVTGRNANVFYELGIAHVRKDHVVLITQSIEDVPFDLKHLDLLPYQPNPPGMRNLRPQLAAILRSFTAEPLADIVRNDVKVLHWEMSPRASLGAGLVVHNVGSEIALDLEGQRVTPTGTFDASRALKSLMPGERRGINPGWERRPKPNDAPDDVPGGKYLTRVLWSDRFGNHHVGDWTPTDKTST